MVIPPPCRGCQSQGVSLVSSFNLARMALAKFSTISSFWSDTYTSYEGPGGRNSDGGGGDHGCGIFPSAGSQGVLMSNHAERLENHGRDWQHAQCVTYLQLCDY